MSVDKPILYMLIGIPYAGKSTYTRKLSHCNVLSTDNHIEAMASWTNLSYNEAFKLFYKEAEFNLNEKLHEFTSNGYDFVWDQTNITKKSRAKKLAKIPDNYHKIAVFFPTPDDEELNRRIASRKDKVIPKHALQQMKKQLEFPDITEGFDEIIVHHDVVTKEEANV